MNESETSSATETERRIAFKERERDPSYVAIINDANTRIMDVFILEVNRANR